MSTKIILSIVLVAFVALSLSACGSDIRSDINTVVDTTTQVIDTAGNVVDAAQACNNTGDITSAVDVCFSELDKALPNE